MNWLNLRTEILHSPEFIGSDPIRRATWLSLSLWCAQQENGGRIVGGAKWTDRRWQQTAGVTADEAACSCELYQVEGGDVVLWGYDADKEAEVQALREAGRRGGAARTEAKIAAARANGAKRNPSQTQAPLGSEPKRNPSQTQAPLGSEPKPTPKPNPSLNPTEVEVEGELEVEVERKEKGMQGAEAGPATPPASVADALALTSEPPTKPAKAKRAPKATPQTDAEWLVSLAASPAYAGMDVPREHAKASEWCRVRQQALSRQRFINWLNRADKPLTASNAQRTATTGRHFSDCNDYSKTGI